MRLFTIVGCAAILLATFISPAESAAAAPRDFAIPGGHFYTEAGGSSGGGFGITDDQGVKLWTEFQRLGGVRGLGYPISDRFVWDGFTVQSMQKAVLQWHPELGRAELVNLYDRVHILGKDPWLQAYRGIAPMADWTSDSHMTWAQVEARHLALLQGHAKIKAKYDAAPGDPVKLYGLPMAPVTPDNPTKPNYFTLRCQRVTIQEWVVDAPASGAHKGDVVITNAGDEAKLIDGKGIYPSNATLTPTVYAPPPVVATPPPVASKPAPTSTSAMRYAFAVHMYNGQETAVLDAVQGSGFGWIKQQVEWKTIQDAPGDFSYGELDTIVNAAAARHVNVLLSIAKAPGWAALGPDRPYPKNPADLAAFVSNMAARYKGKVQAYEIWNEENFAVEAGPGNINAGNYVELLHAAHDAIKAADPAALVVSGAPTPTGVNNPNIAIDDATFIGQMYAYKGGAVRAYFDVLGAHAEPWANPPEENFANHTPGRPYSSHPSFFFRRLEDYRAIMVANGDGGKQIFETEFGYDSCPSPAPVPNGYGYCALISEQQQADYLVRAFSHAKANYPWLGMIAVWNLNFQAVVGMSDEKWGWGVVRGDFTPRPAYTALKDMVK